MAQILLDCRYCATTRFIDDKYVGSAASCTKCQLTFTVPKPDIYFSCPHCSQDLALNSQCLADETPRKVLSCPQCAGTIKVRLDDENTPGEVNTETEPQIVATCPKCKRDHVPFICPNCDRLAGGMNLTENGTVECYCGVETDTIACPDCGATITRNFFFRNPLSETFFIPSAPSQAKTMTPCAEYSPPYRVSTLEPNYEAAKACPFCGEQIRSDAHKCRYCHEFLSEQPLQSASNNQSATSAESETVVWQSRPSAVAFVQNGIWSFLLIITGVLFMLSGLSIAYGAICFFAGLGILIYCNLALNSVRYTITSNKVMSEGGIISRYSAEVSIDDIRTINISKGCFERLFSLGSLGFASAGTFGFEVLFQAIENPEGVRDAIVKLQKQSRRDR